MPDTQQRLEQLLSNSNWSPSDKEWLLWYMENTDAEELQELMLWWHNQELQADNKIKDQVSKLMWQHITAHTGVKDTSVAPVVHRVHFLKTSWFRYAAAIIVIAGGVAVWWEISRSDRNDGALVATVSENKDIQPGTNRAILTVGNNRIALASNKTGINVGSTITYNDGERIADAGQLLELSTPKGGQYQAVLPDGSKVWLNAASSIRFPSKFVGDKREIEVNGEAYIEVAKNSKQPFFVHTAKTTVQVLGTSFNVNAYQDEESEKTTLIEGSVRVLVNGIQTIDHSTVLRPGQQGQLLNGELSVINNQADVAIAWKNGWFRFNRSPLPVVMRQLARWYDLEVIYEKGVPDVLFAGEMGRDLSLSQVLKILSNVGVNFKVDGKKLIVTS